MAVSIDFSGKRGVVFGVANQRSIAWAISERLIEAGAELAFTYLNERLRGPVEKAVSAVEDPILIECDATDDGDVQSVYDQVGDKWGSIDFVVHSVAYAERDDLGVETFRLPDDKASAPRLKPPPIPSCPSYHAPFP